MKAKVKIEKEVELKTVIIEFPPRYIGDSDDDDFSPGTPMLQDGIWKASVDIDTGKIEGWPPGQSSEFFCKVCDKGTYTLIDDNGGVVASIDENYVPNNLIPGEYGDYISMKINDEGVITNWPARPSVSEFFEDDE